MGRDTHLSRACRLPFNGKPYWTPIQLEYECLPLAVVEERCREEGKRVKFSYGNPYCDSSTQGEVSVGIRSNGNNERLAFCDRMCGFHFLNQGKIWSVDSHKAVNTHQRHAIEVLEWRLVGAPPARLCTFVFSLNGPVSSSHGWTGSHRNEANVGAIIWKFPPSSSLHRCLFQSSRENTTKLVFQPLFQSPSGNLTPQWHIRGGGRVPSLERYPCKLHKLPWVSSSSGIGYLDGMCYLHRGIYTDF